MTTALQSMSTAGFAVALRQIRRKKNLAWASSMLTYYYRTCMLWRVAKKFKFGCSAVWCRVQGNTLRPCCPVFCEIILRFLPLHPPTLPCTPVSAITAAQALACSVLLLHLRPTAFTLLRYCSSFLSQAATALHIVRGPTLFEKSAPGAASPTP